MFRKSRPSLPIGPTLVVPVLVTALASILFFAPTTKADDRSLLRSNSGDPYVFVIFDTSGSMNYSVACDESDAANDIDPWDGRCTIECPYDDATCARVCPDVGCLEYAEDAEASTPIEIIIDNDDPGVSRSGDWIVYTDKDRVPEMYGDNYLYTSGTGRAEITYPVNVPETGEYALYGLWHRNANRAEDVRYTIVDANGTHIMEVDQNTPGVGGRFEYLGSFDFRMGTTYSVSIDNYESTTADNPYENGIRASADAIRLYRLPPPATTTCTGGMGYRCQQELCPQGDCQSRLGADDPFSKFYQAKAALYEVVDKAETVHWGFATYDQDDVRLRFKHFMYRVSPTDDAGNPTKTFSEVINQRIANGELSGWERLDLFDWPKVGAEEVFGTGPWDRDVDGTFSYDQNGKGDDNLWDCSDSTRDRGEGGFDDDFWVGCTDDEPVDVQDLWEMERLQRIPKLGATSRAQTWVYVRDTDGRVYRIDYEYGGSGSTLGDDRIKVNLEIHRCRPWQNCRSHRDTLVENMSVYYDKVAEYAEGTGRVGRDPMKSNGFFDFASAPQGNNTCDGLEPNDDWWYLAPGISVSNLQDDAWWDYAFKWPWEPDSRGDEDVVGNALSERVTFFDRGDFIPLDWANNNRRRIQRHLAPNAWEMDADGEIVSVNEGVTDPAARIVPELRSSVYFQDVYDEYGNLDRRRLKLEDETERPIVPYGQTPLYDSMLAFKQWYAGDASCDTNSLTEPCGWLNYAQILDTSWLCRAKYVLFLTDGEETCQNETTKVCQVTDTLQRNFQVNTFVVGFGLPDAGDALACMADTGGTGEPFLPRNKEELVDALESIVLEVQAESRSFASASIPAVQNTAADKIYLSSFTPIRGLSIWPGRLDAFRQPLPLTDDNRPDLDRVCGEPDDNGDPLQSECYLWDVAERLLQQAPTLSDVEVSPSNPDPDYHIGGDDTVINEAGDDIVVQNRRVFYGQANELGDRPGPLRLFYPPDSDTYPDDYLDMAEILAPTQLVPYEDCLDAADPMAADPCTTEKENLDNELQRVVGEILRVKQKSIQVETQVFDEDGNSSTIIEEVACTGQTTPCQYVLGDIFHANPQVVAGPDDFEFFLQDLCGTPPAVGQPDNCVPADEFASAAAMRDRGYREFVRRHNWRRRMLSTATNDGQIHFFDAGIYTAIEDDELGKIEVFTDGSGYEIFSYMPRFLMPIVREQANGLVEADLDGAHVFSMDGSPRVGDVFIDPVPDSITGAFDETQREWRTVMVGGVREAGDVFSSVLDIEGVSGYWALDLTLPDPMDGTVGIDARESEFAPYPPEDPGAFLPGCMTWDDGGRLVPGPEGCQTLSGEDVTFPLELWTFNDTILAYVDHDNDISTPDIQEPFFLDEEVELDIDGDGIHRGGYVTDAGGNPVRTPNNIRDLGDTWSSPIIGQVAVCATGGINCYYDRPSGYTGPNNGWSEDLETRWVAIFGGGEDPRENPDLEPATRGYWIYMIDIETGEAIYKRHLQGTVPSSPAVLDANTDGVADAIYIGTTEGLLYKIDLRALDPDTGLVPGVDPVTIPSSQIIGYTGPPVAAQRIDSVAWDPFPIFYVESPIFYPPALFRVPERDQYGFAFGTGDREDLWRLDVDFPGYFIVGVDDDFVRRAERSVGEVDELPLRVEQLVNFSYDEALPAAFDGNTLPAEDRENLLLISTDADGDGEEDGTDRRPGWVMTFPVDKSDPANPEEDFRATNEPFLVSNILVFSMFQPVIVPGESETGSDGLPVCGRGGRTLAFTVFLQNGKPLGNPLDADGDPIRGCVGRCEEVRDFTTAVHIDRTASKNPPPSGGPGSGRNITDVVSEIDKQMADAIRNAIMDQMPRNCQFNPSYEVVISALRSTTGVNVFARIPVVVCPSDWKQ